MGRKREREPDWWVNVGGTYPKGESSRFKLVIALLTFSGAIIAALIVSRILPDAVADVWGRMVKDRPPSSGTSPLDPKEAGGKRQVTVGHRQVLPLPSAAAAPAGQELLDVAADGSRFVAVGWTGTATDSDGVVWISRNAESWTPATDPTDAFRHRTGNQKLYGAVASTNRFVAVGSDGEAAGVWVSKDGQEWAEAPHEAGAFSEGGRQLMRSVASHNRNLVAVGARGPDGGGEAAGWYLSTEGVWRRATVRSGAAQPSGDAVMRDVAWVDGKFVAVGTTRANGAGPAGYEAAVWTSDDGQVWMQLPTTDVDARCTDGGCGGDQAMYSVATDKRSAVAVGLAGASQCKRRAAVWRSVDDGSTWRRVFDAKALGGKATRMNAVVATSKGFLAVGSQGCSEQQRAAVWESPDGLSWGLVAVKSPRGWESMAGAALSPRTGTIAGSRGDELATASGLTWRITPN